MLVKIGDGKLFAEIETRGAELQRVYNSEGSDFLWEGDARFWGRRAPVLFPICGGMKNDSYTLGGKSFHMPKHGFCRDAEFTCGRADGREAVFYIESDPGRKALFPFDFRFSITYAVKDASLEVTYTVENLGKEEMYFSVGSHEAYACPEGIEKYRLEFEKPERLESLIIADNMIQHGTVLVGEDVKTLPLKYGYFAVDALCFRNLKSKRISLVGCGRKIDVSFNDFEFVLFWTKPKAPFLCIELNCGTDDFVDTDGRIETKEGIVKLAAGDVFERKHAMRFSFKV